MAACGKASEQTVRDLLNLSYANLAMAHAAVSDQALRYQRTHYMIRARLLAGLRKGTMRMGSFLEDERLKLQLPQSCCYCGSNVRLSIDHLVPLNQGGLDLREHGLGLPSLQQLQGRSGYVGLVCAPPRVPPVAASQKVSQIGPPGC